MRYRQALVVPLFLLVMFTFGCGMMDWSPDGKKIVTVWPSIRDHTVLRVVDVSTGRSCAVPDSRDATDPRWSPDGRYIAFVRNEAGSRVARLYDTRGGTTTPIDARDCAVLVWREDSARLLVCTAEAALCFAMPGTALTWEAQLPEPARSVAGAAWIPDTDSVALAAGRDLWLIEGAQVARLTTTGDVLGFGVRPGGKELIWARASRNPRYVLLSLYVLALKERSARRLPLPYRVVGINPSPRTPIKAVETVAFSPDGKHMAVACSFAPPRPRHWLDIQRVYVMDLDGKHVVEVETGGLGGPLMPPGPTAFSPDGRRVSLLIGTDTQTHLWVCNSDGTGGRNVLASVHPAGAR